MYKKIISLFLFNSFLFSASGGSENHYIDFPLFSIIPFLGILLSIALVPLYNNHFWELHYGKVSLFWALLFLIPTFIFFGVSFSIEQILHVAFLEYFPFIILLLALFTIAGGVQLTGTLRGTPKLNSGLILLGTIFSSWIGTTGSAILLIRPLIRANKNRKYNVHIIIFFIILVANIGGALTPLGDPPLFLGFLNGIDFFWTTRYLLFPMLIHVVFILTLFFIIDTYFYNREEILMNNNSNELKPIQVRGKINFILILGVLSAVLMSGSCDFGYITIVNHIRIEKAAILRDLCLLSLTYLSWKFTDQNLRKSNGFTWFPILEVGKLFAGIFITIIPVITILKLGQHGSLSGIIGTVTNTDGSPINFMYFWLTGVLSAFLDNAPTYLVFFNTAGGNSEILMNKLSNTLLAISSGAVFFGALTYIGNAPNFMIRSIAEENGIKMPSFFGYMLWSSIILFPIFVIYSVLYF